MPTGIVGSLINTVYSLIRIIYSPASIVGGITGIIYSLPNIIYSREGIIKRTATFFRKRENCI